MRGQTNKKFSWKFKFFFRFLWTKSTCLLRVYVWKKSWNEKKKYEERKKMSIHLGLLIIFRDCSTHYSIILMMIMIIVAASLWAPIWLEFEMKNEFNLLIAKHTEMCRSNFVFIQIQILILYDYFLFSFIHSFFIIIINNITLGIC